MAGGYESMRDHRGDVSLSCDVVVVGSGAGGSVVATELAESGLDVVVLEEGPNVAAKEYATMRPSESLRHMFRDGALSIAIGLGDTPAINLTMGRCVGGSSVLTGGVCFRTPESVLDHWSKELGLSDITPSAVEPFFERVEKIVHVEEVPVDMRSRSTELFVIGAEKRGFDMRPMRRNTKGCNGCGRCNFGCPHGAKLSVDVSYLPRAVERGARVLSHCLVERVVIANGRATGVEGRLLNRPGAKPGDRLDVRAKRVVVACGAWHTPLLLRRSGIRNRHLGKNLTLHPGFRMLARFEDPVRGWRGALQSVWSPSVDGVTLTALFVPVGVLGATMPGVGVEHTSAAARIAHLAMFGGALHDDPGGTIHRGLGREPIVTYRMSKRDRARIPVLVREMAECFFEAGALEVFPPVLGLRGQSRDEFRKLDLDRVPGSRFECGSQHPLGSAQMGRSASEGVVDTNGKVFGVEELFVADGSITPTSLGVNPQLSIMTFATRIAWRMRD